MKSEPEFFFAVQMKLQNSNYFRINLKSGNVLGTVLNPCNMLAAQPSHGTPSSESPSYAGEMPYGFRGLAFHLKSKLKD